LMLPASRVARPKSSLVGIESIGYDPATQVVYFATVAARR
jgi:hypothetical protein